MPCGFYTTPTGSALHMPRFSLPGQISGPLMDRIDIHVKSRVNTGT